MSFRIDPPKTTGLAFEPETNIEQDDEATATFTISNTSSEGVIAIGKILISLQPSSSGEPPFPGIVKSVQNIKKGGDLTAFFGYDGQTFPEAVEGGVPRKLEIEAGDSVDVRCIIKTVTGVDTSYPYQGRFGVRYSWSGAISRLQDDENLEEVEVAITTD